MVARIIPIKSKRSCDQFSLPRTSIIVPHERRNPGHATHVVKGRALKAHGVTTRGIIDPKRMALSLTISESLSCNLFPTPDKRHYRQLTTVGPTLGCQIFHS